ncbi:coiled-coil domain-containing protein 12 isoform X2 [Prionailurus bengalensis]|uniref:coiled-coil domain-containing protein 12 isoform X2 n=1 Tax=Prionailurus bengalensis TaxID=37029 RepID=UPI001CA8204D|nr:coiled-coil domain-containing protein 12 isoform X2 [Prionailurus bengalensis]
MAATAAGVGRLEEEALRRKERLKALREKTGRKDKEDGEPKTKQLREGEEEGEKHRELRLRNYVPEDEDLKRRRVPQAKPVAVEEKVKEQLEAAKPEPVIEEVDLANLAPRKPDCFLFCEMGLLILSRCPCDQADTEWGREGPCGLGLVFYLTLGPRCRPHPSPAIL